MLPHLEIRDKVRQEQRARANLHIQVPRAQNDEYRSTEHGSAPHNRQRTPQRQVPLASQQLTGDEDHVQEAVIAGIEAHRLAEEILRPERID
jgi:hypothetical protein